LARLPSWSRSGCPGIYTYIFIYLYNYTHIYLCIYIYTYIFTYIDVCMICTSIDSLSIYIRICTYIRSGCPVIYMHILYICILSIRIYIYVYISLYLFSHVNININIYIYISICKYLNCRCL
jgi:hypothetical protein